MQWSLKWKIQLWHGLILTSLAVVLGILFYQHERKTMIQEMDWMLNQSIPPLIASVSSTRSHGPSSRKPPQNVGHLGPEQPRVSEDWQAARFLSNSTTTTRLGPRNIAMLFKEVLKSDGYYFMIWDPSGSRLIDQSENAPNFTLPENHPPGVWFREIPGERREFFQRAKPCSVLVGRYTEEFEATLASLRMKIFLVGITIVIAALAVGTLLVSGSLRPLQLIRQRNRAVAEGNLSERIELKSGGGSLEMAELSRDLNTTFASLEKLFERQAAFTADASHELRTPLTALIVQIKRGHGGKRSEEDYRKIFEICDRSLIRLKRIVDDLLELSRYDSGQVELDRDELALDLIVSTIADDYRPMVQAQGSQLTCEVASCEVNCDPFRIEQVVSNLITNALKHNSNPVNIALRVRCENSWAIIEIEDDGVGIEPKHCDQLFDRFFQGQKNEDRENEDPTLGPNSGLGLAISKAIIEAHCGTIQVRSEPGTLTVFEIRLPKARTN